MSMRCHLTIPLLALTLMTLPRVVVACADVQTSSCQTSPTQDLLPDVVGPMTGASPAWLVDGSAGWSRADEPVKTLWVLLRTGQSVRIAGRRVDGPGQVLLRRGDDMPAETLVVSNPIRETVIPGGVRPEVMQSYVFIPSHVFYPSPGCWEFTIRIGQDEARITRELK
jgi:hypothetical protein